MKYCWHLARQRSRASSGVFSSLFLSLVLAQGALAQDKPVEQPPAPERPPAVQPPAAAPASGTQEKTDPSPDARTAPQQVVASAPSGAQDEKTQKRLDSIEKKLEDLGSAIKLLLEQQTAASKIAAPTAPADTKKPAALKPISLSKDWLKEIPFRTIGPANMGGRITEILVHITDPSFWWIVTT